MKQPTHAFAIGILPILLPLERISKAIEVIQNMAPKEKETYTKIFEGHNIEIVVPTIRQLNVSVIDALTLHKSTNKHLQSTMNIYTMANVQTLNTTEI